jgi:hypothetical protein
MRIDRDGTWKKVIERFLREFQKAVISSKEIEQFAARQKRKRGPAKRS